MKLARLWPLSWILVIPLISLLGIWMIGTAEMYRELALRNLGDERLGGMTLHKAGDLQFRYLMQSLRRGAIRSVTLGHEEPLPRIHLFAQDADLAALDEHRPRSGQQYIPARIYQPGKDGNDGDFSRVQIRYRGDFAVHWGLFKRSYRVKTKRSDLFHGLRRFNLITPKNEVLYQNHAGYEMARLLGVMAPRSEMVNLNLNGKDRGVHLFVEQISETTLRDLDRMPGDIYSGDELYGPEVWDGIDLKLFDSAGFWNKVAVNNHYPEQHKAPLKALLDALHRRDTQRLESLVDLDAFARFNLWEQLAVSSHTDDTHNWRLYYDPGRGRFYPILWDGIPWAMYFVPADLDTWQPPDQIIASSLMGALFESPRFQDIRRRVFADFLGGTGPEALLEMLRGLNRKVGLAAETDAAILTENLNWVTPEESRQHMQLTLRVVEKNLAHMTALYGHYPVQEARVAEPIRWSGTVTVEENLYLDRPLQIAPGTRVRLGDDVSLFIRAGVSARGTEDAPITFQPADGGIFGAIVVEGQSSSGSVLEHVSISGGSGYKDDLMNYSGMLSVHDVDEFTLRFCHLSDNQRYDDQFHVVYSSVRVEDCIFERAPMDAVDLDMSQAEIRRTRFTANGNDGLDLMGTRVVADQLSFESNGDKGVSAGERSLLDLSDSSFAGNLIGIQIKDDSLVIGRRLSFAASDLNPLDAYAKNWRYGTGGSGWFCETGLAPGQAPTVDAGSRIKLGTRSCDEMPREDFQGVRRMLDAGNE